MVELPVGVNNNNLIDDLRIFSWEAADILLYYSQKLKDSEQKNEIIKILALKRDKVSYVYLGVDEKFLKHEQQNKNFIKNFDYKDYILLSLINLI